MNRSDARGALTRRMYIFAAALGFFALVYGAFAFASGDVAVGSFAAAFVVLSSVFVRRARHLRRAGRAVTAINEAYAARVAGRTEEAEALLATMTAEELRIPYVRRAVASQKALGAMNRGDLAQAVTEATRAIEGRPRFATWAVEETQIDAARSLRALAHASLGQRTEALADAAAVETASFASSIARASLARAVLLARDRNFEALHAHYEAEGAVLIDALTPRERALSRALRRMGRAQTRSVYREAAQLDDDALDETNETNETGARAWIRKVAPEAAKFVAKPAVGERAATAMATDGPARSVPSASAAARTAFERVLAGRDRAATRKSKRRSLAIFVATFAVTVLVGTASVLVVGDDHPRKAARAGDAASVLDGARLGLAGTAIAAVVAVAAAVLVFRWRARHHRRRLLAATVTLARKDDPAAFAELEALSRTGLTARRIEADRALAGVAIRRGDFARALADTERLLQRSAISAAMRAATQDLATPDAIATHAYALAALDRSDEALAELALLGRDYASFPFAARASFRVHLMNAIRSGDYREAARISATRAPDMPIELRDDLLAELACAAAAGGLPEKEAEALRGELHDMPDVGAWLEAVAPGLQARIARGPANVRIAGIAANDEHEHEAEPAPEKRSERRTVVDPPS